MSVRANVNEAMKLNYVAAHDKTELLAKIYTVKLLIFTCLIFFNKFNKIKILWYTYYFVNKFARKFVTIKINFYFVGLFEIILEFLSGYQIIIILLLQVEIKFYFIDKIY